MVARLSSVRCGVFILLILLSVVSAQAQDFVYYLLDKSGSMGEVDPVTQQSILNQAKKRVVESLDRIPPEGGRRRVKIIPFDVRRAWAPDTEFATKEQAAAAVNAIESGGMTQIGDRIEEVRQELIQAKAGSVEIHLFSDLKENMRGQVGLQAAVERMNNSFASALQGLDFQLYCYTWRGVSESELKKELPLNLDASKRMTFLPVNEQVVRAALRAPDSFRIELRENAGSYVGALPTQITLEGDLHPGLAQKGATMRIRANWGDAPSEVRVLLNGKEDVPVSLSNIELSTGRFRMDRVDLKIENAAPYLGKMGGELLNKAQRMVFTPTLIIPPDALSQAELTRVQHPTPAAVGFRFSSAPYVFIRNYPDGKRLYRKDVYEGASVVEPLDLAWNQAAVGRKVQMRMPVANGLSCFLQDEKGERLPDSLTLDDSLHRFLRFTMTNATAVSDVLAFYFHGENTEAVRVPVELACRPPLVALKFADAGLIQVVAGLRQELDARLAFQAIPDGKTQLLSINLSGAKDIAFSLYDPRAPDFEATLGASVAANMQVSAARPLGYRCLIPEPRDVVIDWNAVALTPGTSLALDDQVSRTLNGKIHLRAVRPEIEWTLSDPKGNRLGTQRGNRLAFQSRGQPRVTFDPAMQAAGWKLVAKLMPSGIEALLGQRIKAVLASDLPADRRLIKTVRFVANDSEMCTLSRFIEAPNLTFVPDDTRRPSIGYKTETGVVRFELEGAASATPSNLIKMPEIFYEFVLKP